MLSLLVLLMPLFVAAGLLYLFMTMGDAVVSAATDWIKPGRHDDGGES